MNFKKNVFVPFLVIGDPDYSSSVQLIKSLVDSGAGALELGFAFSDPIADGPTIQKANNRALGNGITTEKSFSVLREIRAYSKIPISLLVSANLVLQYGLENFYKTCKELEIEAILCPDIPLEESAPFMEIAKKYGISQICIVSPTTDEDRMKKLSSLYGGYVYLVSLLGTTGVRTTMEQSLSSLIQKTKKYFSIPVYVGFGISKPEHVKEVMSYGADGAISGSALCNIVEGNIGNLDKMISSLSLFCSDMVAALTSS